MFTHLTLIRFPSACASQSGRQATRSAGNSSSDIGRWRGPFRLTTPDATGRRFVLTLIHSSAPSAQRDAEQRRFIDASAAMLDHPA